MLLLCSLIEQDMSFIQSTSVIFIIIYANRLSETNGDFLKDLWPIVLASTVDDRHREDLESWQIVPTTFTKICDWAYIAKNQNIVDHTRLYHVLYKNPGGDQTTLYPVVLRLQGFLGHFELSPLGTWNGWLLGYFLKSQQLISLCSSPDTAAGSIQYITLNSGGHTDLWESTHESIRLIRQLVHSSLEGANLFIEPDVNSTRNVYLQCRVFNKVSDYLRMRTYQELEVTNFRLVPKARHHPVSWQKEMILMDGSQVLGSRLYDGRTAACSPFVLSRGDFVDIGLVFDISTSRTPNGRIRNNVHLSIVHVLQLVPVCIAQEVCTLLIVLYMLQSDPALVFICWPYWWCHFIRHKNTSTRYAYLRIDVWSAGRNYWK